jgi:predicted DNA-binding transcriptional regulator YafY
MQLTLISRRKRRAIEFTCRDLGRALVRVLLAGPWAAAIPPVNSPGQRPTRLLAPNSEKDRRRPGFYRALTTRVHHHLMMTRDDKSAVILGLRKHHGLLAAFLEAADKIDHKLPKLVNVKTRQASTAPQSPQVGKSPVSAFALRRANLVALECKRGAED